MYSYFIKYIKDYEVCNLPCLIICGIMCVWMICAVPPGVATVPAGITTRMCPGWLIVLHVEQQEAKDNNTL